MAAGKQRPPLLGAAVLQLYSPAPANATRAQRACGELWRSSLIQALARDGALAARAGLRWELSFNAKGARLAVSGRAGRVPLLLSRAVAALLGHNPRLASAAEWESAQRAALAGVDAGVPRVSERPAAAAALREASAAEVALEAARFLRSVEGADLLLAGPVGAGAAAELSAEVRGQLGTRLRLGGEVERTTDRLRLRDVLRDLEGLLYRPRWQPQPLAQNACFDPGLGATLDQCGLVANA